MHTGRQLGGRACKCMMCARDRQARREAIAYSIDPSGMSDHARAVSAAEIGVEVARDALAAARAARSAHIATLTEHAHQHDGEPRP